MFLCSLQFSLIELAFHAMKKISKYFELTNPKDRIKLWWFSGAFFTFGMFIKITSELLEDEKLQNIDKNILLFIGRNIRTSTLNVAAVDITSIGSPAIVIIISFLTLALLWRRKDIIGLNFYLINVLGASIWGQILKSFVGRTRPQIIPHLVEVSGHSYPSGHSIISAVTTLSIAILVERHSSDSGVVKISFFSAFFLTSLTALSRIYLGVHYPSDVCSGVLVGISWVLFTTATFKTFFRFSKMT